MQWSYSRIKSYDDCPYRFYLKYIDKCESEDKFYASYGSFMHKIIEKYYKKELSKDEMLTEFLVSFSDNVKGKRPSSKIVEKYIQCGIDYLEGFEPFKYSMVDVEKKINFKVNGLNFEGIIDYLGEKDGEYYIIDNKSRDLKPRSKRKNPTLNDKEIDSMLKQLYLYSVAVKQEYGKYPKSLCFNCFKSGTFIEEPFREEICNETVEWLSKKVDEIKETDDFYPVYDYFVCNNICDVSNECIYCQEIKQQGM